MGVYVKGMEMPTSCNECRFAVDGWCYAYPKQANGDALNRRVRTNWCPLVEIPKHGRLIDADALGVTDFELVMCRGEYKELAKLLLEKIDAAPIIIPAEERERSMSEYIKREDALRQVMMVETRENMYRCMKNIPAADVRPVVRCCECKWFQINMRQDGYLPKGVPECECRHWCGSCDPTDYCSYGARMDGDGE